MNQTASEPILTTDGIPLKVSLQKAERKNKIRAFLLVAPLLIFILVTFLVPIGDMLVRSVDDRYINTVFPKTFEVYKKWERQDLPSEELYKTMFFEVKEASGRSIGKATTRMNYAKSGWKSLLKKSKRKFKKIEEGPYKEQMIAADKRWGDIEYWKALGERYGGKKEDSFDVIAPSLPGFGFSGSPKKPIGPRKMAKIMNKLMTKNLRYKKYLSQGGDWGSTISNWLGYDHFKSCKAIHVNFLSMRLFKGAKTKQEKNWEKRFKRDQIMEEGYRTQQATKPQSLSYAMMDSPVGAAAWILEKFFSWSDIKNNKIDKVYSKDTLLANIMVYLVTNTFNTASWIYFGRREEGGRFFPKNFKKIRVPTAVAEFPKEMSEWPPKSYIKRIFNLQRWTKMKKGGHFAALEQPDLLVKDIRAFARTLR